MDSDQIHVQGTESLIIKLDRRIQKTAQDGRPLKFKVLPLEWPYWGALSCALNPSVAGFDNTSLGGASLGDKS